MMHSYYIRGSPYDIMNSFKNFVKNHILLKKFSPGDDLRSKLEENNPKINETKYILQLVLSLFIFIYI